MSTEMPEEKEREQVEAEVPAEAEVSAEIREEATALLEDPNILDRAAEFMDELGLCGEKLNRRVVFLAGVGGIVGEPIHLVIKGDSSGGKNTLAKTAFRLLPEEYVLTTSGLSPQALAYHASSDEEEEPRIEGVLLIDEAEGIKGAEYTLRQAMSEGRVSRLTVGQNGSGGWSSQRLDVRVDASIVTTTTATALHRENQTRVFDLWIDESEAQTRRVLRAQARNAAAGAALVEKVEASLNVWREALGRLRPARVVIPFGDALADAFPVHQPRARRDFERILSLIRVSALLHQEQREHWGQKVVATMEDYARVYPLLQAVLEPSMQGLNDTALALCKLHGELAEDGDGWVKRTDLEAEAARRRIARSTTTVRKWCGQLHELGYWEGHQTGPHRAWEYRKVRDSNEEPVALPRPEELEAGSEGTSSRPGRRSPRGEAGSAAPPSENGAEESVAAPAPATVAPPEEEEGREEPEKPHGERERSSHAAD